MSMHKSFLINPHIFSEKKLKIPKIILSKKAKLCFLLCSPVRGNYISMQMSMFFPIYDCWLEYIACNSFPKTVIEMHAREMKFNRETLLCFTHLYIIQCVIKTFTQVSVVYIHN